MDRAVDAEQPGQVPAADAGLEAPRDPEEAEATAGRVSGDISPDTRLGPVHLTVADLDRSLAYYRSQIGLSQIEPAPPPPDGRARSATLGVGDRALLVLVESPGAPAPALGSTGLYHFALLVPERADLARWLAHAARERVPMVGASDHFVSEALYLSDPDGHGIEIYWDRPRALWEGQVGRMTTLPLDLDGLLRELSDPAAAAFGGLPSGTTIGHIHLKVAAIAPTVSFYRDLLGFGLMASLGTSAAFLSAGGYHHHVGANTWESAGGQPPGPGAAALRHATIVLPDAAERERAAARLRRGGCEPDESPEGVFVRDPSGNRLLLAVATGEG